MTLEDIATKEGIQFALNKISKLESPKSEKKFGFISHDLFKKDTGLADSTIYRLVEKYKAFKAYKFKGSNKKFYKISELEAALESGL